ncbi:MAG TPA: hypothetical protein VMF91_05345 [Bryobacteraceae bacterium]|nr:hypothetical protein [Bryobacteraceae bacterium]
MRTFLAGRSFLLPLVASMLFVPGLLNANTICGETSNTSKYQVTLDWNAPEAASASQIAHSGNYCFTIKNTNPLYSYAVSNQVVEQQTNALADLTAAIGQLKNAFVGASTTNEVKLKMFSEQGSLSPAGACSNTDLTNFSKAITAFENDANTLYPPADPKGKYPSETLAQTRIRWTANVKPKLDADLSAFDLLSPPCRAGQDMSKAIKAAEDAVTNVDEMLKTSPSITFVLSLNRTEDLVTTVTESYKGQTTNTATYELKPSWTIYTASGGFLLTTLAARTYNSRTVPNASGTGTQNVLEVDNASGIRPALTALLNFNFTPTGAWCKCGLAASSGLVYDVSSGKADTSHFGVFAGPSIHLFDRFIVTVGYHFGEFADFPSGYRNGQVIPPNTGTPTATNRWSARLGFAFTYQFKSSRDKTKSTQTTKNPKPTPSAQPPHTASIPQNPASPLAGSPSDANTQNPPESAESNSQPSL